MKRNVIISKKNLKISEVMMHILGYENARFLAIAQQYYHESRKTDDTFIMPFRDVKDRYHMGRSMQDKCRAYLEGFDILRVKPNKFRVSAGKTYSFNSEAVMALNYIVSLSEEINYRKRLKRDMIGDFLNMNKLVDWLESNV